jgi:hypothetical protein
MKSLLLSLSLLILAASCDNPQRNRLNGGYITGNELGQPDGSTSGTNTGSTNTNPWQTSTTGTTTSGASGSSTQKPPGFENCDISAKYFAAVIGYMGICQSTLDETSVAIISTVTDGNRTCLIPTFKDNTGSSTYLGQPQCFAPQEGVITNGKLYKTRATYSHLPINGVMVMKQNSLAAYFTCMDAYVSFTHPSCPNGAKTNYQCDQMARSLMAAKCNDFKVSNPYIDIRLK